MKKLALFALALAATFAAPRAEAQFSLLPYIGYNTEDDTGFQVGIGTDFVAPFNIANLDLSIRPSVEYQFFDLPDGVDVDVTALQFNGDVVARFAGSPTLQPYGGAGIALFYQSFDDGDDSDSDTELGFNLFGGAEFSMGQLNPFAQARISFFDPEFGDYDPFAIQVGLRVSLGN